MRLVNLTPDTLELYGTAWVLIPHGKVAKVGPPIKDIVQLTPDPYDNTGVKVIGMHRMGGLDTYLWDPTTKKTSAFYSETDGVYLVVSLRVRLANPQRKDLINPSGYERDSHGGVCSFKYFEGWGK